MVRIFLCGMLAALALTPGAEAQTKRRQLPVSATMSLAKAGDNRLLCELRIVQPPVGAPAKLGSIVLVCQSGTFTGATKVRLQLLRLQATKDPTVEKELTVERVTVMDAVLVLEGIQDVAIPKAEDNVLAVRIVANVKSDVWAGEAKVIERLP